MNKDEGKTVNHCNRRLMARNIAAGGAILVGAMMSLTSKASAQIVVRPRPSVRCFLPGTRILTPNGQVAVETLGEGDLVVTRSGEAKPISRLHKSSFSRLPGGRWPKDVLPVCIKAGALGDGRPHTDLYMSMTHCVLLDGVLVPVGDLVNGTTITIAECTLQDRIDYFHIELAEHDVVTAEGALCESQLNMDASMPSSVPCLPIVRLGGAVGALGSRFRSAMAPIIDRRNRFDLIRDRLEDRAETLRAA